MWRKFFWFKSIDSIGEEVRKRWKLFFLKHKITNNPQKVPYQSWRLGTSNKLIQDIKYKNNKIIYLELSVWHFTLFSIVWNLWLRCKDFFSVLFHCIPDMASISSKIRVCARCHALYLIQNIQTEHTDENNLILQHLIIFCFFWFLGNKWLLNQVM